MEKHLSKHCETVEDTRAAGRMAGENAGQQMIARCGPATNTKFSSFVDGMCKALREAGEQMRKSGTPEDRITIWGEEFQKSLNPYLRRMAMIEKLTGKG